MEELVTKQTLKGRIDDIDKAVNPGTYEVFGKENTLHLPTGAYDYGTLRVFITGSFITQIYFTDLKRGVYARTSGKGSQIQTTGWIKLSYTDAV